METTWGDGEGGSNPHYVGIAYSLSGDNTDLTVRYYVRATYAVDDDQVLTLSNAISGTVDFRKDGPGTQLVATRTRAVSPGSSYTVRADLSDVYNGGTPFHSRMITVPAGPPDQVGQPVVDNIGSRTARADWNVPGTNGAPITGYQLHLDNNPSFSSPASATTISTFYNMSGMTPGTTWYVRVRANSSAGYGPWSTARSFLLDAEPPDAPNTPTISALGSRTARASWNVPGTNGTAITSYTVALDDNPSFSSPSTPSTISTFYDMSGMTPGTDWWVRVRANSAAGPGPWSGARAFTTLAEVPDAPPGAVASLDDGRPRIEWGAAGANGTPVTGYQVWRASDAGFTEDTTYTTVGATVRGYTFADVGIPVVYMRVRANSAVGYGPWSAVVSVEVPTPGWVNVGGTWRRISRAYVRAGGAWRPARIYVRAGGVWRG